MAKIDDLIEKLCPNGVEYKPIWSLTAWDKKFNGVDKEKQKKIISYKYYLSTDFAKVERKDGNIKYISTGISGDDRYTTEELAGDYLADGEVVCIPWGGTPNVKYHKGKFVTGDNRIATSLDINILSNKFLYYWMQSKINVISKFYRGSGIKHPSMKDVLDMNIAVPPLEIQCEIVHILDDFTLLSAELSAELKARQKQYEYYASKLFTSFKAKDYPMGELAKFVYGYTDKAIDNGNTRFIRITDINEQGCLKKEDIKYINMNEEAQKSLLKKGDLVMARTGATFGKTLYFDDDVPSVYASFLIKIIPDNTKLLNKYYWHFTKTQLYWSQANKLVTNGGQPQFNTPALKKIRIPIPTLDEQHKVVDILDRLDKICNDISEGLPAEIESRQKQYEYYRDKLLTFKELKVNE